MAARFVDLEAQVDNDVSDESDELDDEELKDFIVSDNYVEKRGDSSSDEEEELEWDYPPPKRKRLKHSSIEETEDVAKPTKRPKKKKEPVMKVSSPSTMESRRFDHKTHSFQVTATNCFPLLGNVVEMMKQDDNSLLNMIVTDDTIILRSFMFELSVMVTVKMNSEIFQDFQVPETKNADQRVMVYNVSKLSSQFSRMKGLDSVGVIMRGSDVGLSMKGLRSNDNAPLSMDLKEIEEEPYDNPDTSLIEYSSEIQLDAKTFCTAIQNMIGKVFSIKMDMKRHALIMYSSDDMDTFEVPISLGPEAVNDISKHTEVKNYRASFKKAHFQPVIKGSKINNMIKLSFADNEPLRARYSIKTGEDFSSENDSVVCIYIGPHDLDLD
jgi:hypothetical protein